MSIERRQQTVRHRNASLSRWMESVVKRSELSALVLADSDGLLLESTVERPAADGLAAIASVVADGDDSAAQARGFGGSMEVGEIRVGGARLLLGAVGRCSASKSAVSEALAGVRRILSLA